MPQLTVINTKMNDEQDVDMIFEFVTENIQTAIEDSTYNLGHISIKQ